MRSIPRRPRSYIVSPILGGARTSSPGSSPCGGLCRCCCAGCRRTLGGGNFLKKAPFLPKPHPILFKDFRMDRWRTGRRGGVPPGVRLPAAWGMPCLEKPHSSFPECSPKNGRKQRFRQFFLFLKGELKETLPPIGNSWNRDSMRLKVFGRWGGLEGGGRTFSRKSSPPPPIFIAPAVPSTSADRDRVRGSWGADRGPWGRREPRRRLRRCGR